MFEYNILTYKIKVYESVTVFRFSKCNLPQYIHWLQDAEHCTTVLFLIHSVHCYIMKMLRLKVNKGFPLHTAETYEGIGV